MRYRYHLVPILILALSGASAHAAEWKECERAKLRLLKLEQRAQNGNHGAARKGSRGKTPDARRNAASLDEWLWKNCRSYASELRTLEQSRM